MLLINQLINHVEYENIDVTYVQTGSNGNRPPTNICLLCGQIEHIQDKIHSQPTVVGCENPLGRIILILMAPLYIGNLCRDDPFGSIDSM